MQVCVLIPTYKEYENLKRLIPLLYEEVYPRLKEVKWSTLVVDDNSNEGTKELLADFQKKYKGLETSYADKKGIGAAMKRGYKYVLANLKPDAVATLEADFVVEPEELVEMVKKLDKYDVVLASRSNEAEYYGGLTIRRLMHVLVNDIICRLIGGMNEVGEHTAACRVIRVKGVLEKVNLDKMPDGYAFFGVILFQLAKFTGRFYEHRVEFFERTEGESKMNLKKVGMMIREMRDYMWAAAVNRFS